MTDQPTRTFGRRRGIPAADDTSEPVTPTPQNSGGWDQMERSAAITTSDFFLKITADPIVIKIIDADPFDNFCSHWIDEITEGSKSVRCWATPECPICRIGDRPSKFSACFNVISLANPQAPAVRVWEAGIKIARQLKDIALDAKKGPLNRDDLYFTVYKQQKTKSVEYVLERVRARDLEEETGVSPLTPEVIETLAADRRTESVKQLLDDDDMAAIVKMLLGQ